MTDDNTGEKRTEEPPPKEIPQTETTDARGAPAWRGVELPGWPVALRGITESIVTTRGPDDRWNVAVLGLHAPDIEETENQRGAADLQVTARTWGRTRTWRNFRERGTGYVQFVEDPLVFVDGALGIREQEHPVLDDAYAWVEVSVERRDSGTDGGTDWVEWKLVPHDSGIIRTVVPTFNRGYAAVVEATVAASRLDVDAYDSDVLWDRIEYFELVTHRCGGPREREAFDRLRELIEE